LAHAPVLGKPWITLGNAMRYDIALDKRLREMAILEVGYIYGAPYEVSHHLKIGLGAGLTEQDVEDVRREVRGLSPKDLGDVERLVLAATREIAFDVDLRQTTWDRLVVALGETEAVELCVVVSYYSGVVRLLAAFGVDVEDEYANLLDRFPLVGPIGGLTELH
jgi:alkylhydroperoxidase family enzyme